MKSVAEFMKSVNRIRFNSMTVADPDRQAGNAVKVGKRSGSCPPFTEETLENEVDCHGLERSASIQVCRQCSTSVLWYVRCSIMSAAVSRLLSIYISLPFSGKNVHPVFCHSDQVIIGLCCKR